MHRLSWFGFGFLVSFVATGVAFSDELCAPENPSAQTQVRPQQGVDTPNPQLSSGQDEHRRRALDRPLVQGPPPLRMATSVILYDDLETPQEEVAEFQRYLQSVQDSRREGVGQAQQAQGKPQLSTQVGRNGDDELEKFREFLVKHRTSTRQSQGVIFSVERQSVGPNGSRCPIPPCRKIRYGGILWCCCPMDERSIPSENPIPPNTMIFAMGEQLIKKLAQADAAWWQGEVFAKIPAGGGAEPTAIVIRDKSSLPRY